MLCSIHLNDNGLYDMGMFESHDNKRTVEEIFDIFGVEHPVISEKTEEYPDPKKFTFNQTIKDPQVIKNIVDEYTKNLS